MKEENIQFEDIPQETSPDTLFTGMKFDTPLPSIQQERHYKNLYEEMLDKCRPSNFTAPEVFESAKVQYAIEIYELLKSNKSKYDVSDEKIPDELKKLRKDAMEQLGIHISTRRIFDAHFSVVNPALYDDRHDYNPQALILASKLYSILLEIQNDWEQLETFASNEDYKFLQKIRLEKNAYEDRIEREKKAYYDQYK